MRARSQRTLHWAPVAVLCLLGSACGSLGEPYLGSFPTSSVPSQAVESDADGGLLDPITGLPGNLSVAALPPRPADYVPAIIVVATEGVGVIERTEDTGVENFSAYLPIQLTRTAEPGEPLDETTSSLPTTTTTSLATSTTSFGQSTSVPTTQPLVPLTQWSLARDDLFGGLVLQSLEGEVMWFPGTGGEPRLVDLDGEFIEVGFSAGTPEALSLRSGQVFRTRLIDNETVLFASLEPGSDLVDLSSSGGVVAMAFSDERCGGVQFLSGDGVPLVIDPFGTLVCDQDARPSIGAIAMSPDGEAVAYTLIQYREDGVERQTDLRAVELTSGAQILATQVGGSGEVIESLAFDGTSAVLLRRSSASSDVVVAGSDSVEIVSIDPSVTPRSVSFARLPLSSNLGQSG